MPPAAGADDARLYPLLERLDRLEELIEEMDELGVATRQEAEQQMAALHAEIDRMTDE